MNRLTFFLTSLVIGISAGVTTLFLLPSDYELIVWAILIITIVGLCIKFFHQKLFWETFLFSITTGATVTGTHLLFIEAYLESHQAEIIMLDAIKILDSYALTLLLIAPIYWLVLGLFSGLLANMFVALNRF